MQQFEKMHQISRLPLESRILSSQKIGHPLLADPQPKVSVQITWIG